MSGMKISHQHYTHTHTDAKQDGSIDRFTEMVDESIKIETSAGFVE
jgi:hypothetical protein